MKTDNELIAKFNVIFKPFEGEENWPWVLPELDPLFQGWKTISKKRYEETLSIAKNNATPFREQDINEIISDIATTTAINECLSYEDFLTWQPNPENIYSIEGKCEIIEYPLIKVSWESQEMFQDRLKNGKRIKFAILLKEEISSSQTFHLNAHADFIVPIKEAEEEESQSQLFVEMFILYDSCNNKLSIVEEQFHITRIK